MPNLQEALAADGYELKRKTAEELAGPCPFCGGEDRFLVWPAQGNGGKYWCRQCNQRGDFIQYLRNKRGLTYQEAAGMAGKGNGRPHWESLGEPVAVYDYTDADGNLLYQVCRYQTPTGKTFKQRRPDGAGGWIWGLSAGEYGRPQGGKDWYKVLKGKSYAEKKTFPACPTTPYRLPEVLKAGTVHICEGEKDCDRLAPLGLVATTNAGGASKPGQKSKWRPEYNQYFGAKHTIILPDNDPPGKAHAQEVARNLHGVTASVKVVELPGLPEKGDVSDWLKAEGTVEQLQALIDAAPEWHPQAPKSLPQEEKSQFLTPQAAAIQARATPAIQFVSGKELEAMDFSEPVWIIPNLLGEGYSILAGRPKLGKSWLALCLAVAVATGGCALGRGELRAAQGGVLYLALEDRLRRIKRRLRQIMGGEAFPPDITFAESWRRLDKGGLEDLETFLKEHAPRLVVIDTLAKVRPPRAKNRDPYEWDMAVGGALQALVHKYNTCFLVIHHTRKSESDDPLDEVSGTTGITGAADAVMVLKRGRGQADGTLTLAGRDIEEQQLALKFHSQDGAWEMLGDANEYAKSEARQEILNILREHGPQSPKEIADLLGKKYCNIKKLLWVMAKKQEIKALGGKYEL